MKKEKKAKKKYKKPVVVTKSVTESISVQAAWGVNMYGGSFGGS